MAVKKGNMIKVEYTGSFDDGTIFDSSVGKEPLEFEAGSGRVIKGFDDAVIDMAINEEKTIKIAPKEAYGDVNPKLMQKIPRDQFPKGHEPKKGMMLGMMTPKGQVPVQIADVDQTTITIDLNHPLAGKTLNFKIKVVDIKES